jgi:hypothetical protein
MLALLVSCGSDSKPDKAAPAPRKSFSQRMDEKNSYQVDGDGNWTPTNDRRSSFESQGASPYFKGKYDKKAYKTEEYTKKSWWGNKDYGHKSYEGDTDGSRFQQTSRFQGQGANEASTDSNLPKTYQTDSYATKAAHEAGLKSLDRPSDPNVENRRDTYVPPEIIDWRQQRSMDLNQSRGILGR